MINNPKSWFLRNVAGAFTAAALPAAGGTFTIEVIATNAALEEVYVDATVTTFRGQSGDSVTAALVAQLNELGFVATEIEYDFGDGPTAAIDIAPGVYEGILGLAEITQDANLNTLQIASWDTLTVVPIDLNNDGVLDEADVEVFLDLMRAKDPFTDLNGDRQMDLRDLRSYVEDLTAVRPRVARPKR